LVGAALPDVAAFSGKVPVALLVMDGLEPRRPEGGFGAGDDAETSLPVFFFAFVRDGNSAAGPAA